MDLRIIFRIDNDTKTRVRMSELKSGDVFEMYEDDFLIYAATATGEPYMLEDGVWGIDADFINYMYEGD